MTKYVWYASYGSNLLRERFLCYIQGGLIPGNDKAERGARNPSLPIDDRRIIIKHDLFFALESEKWQGSGVAFIDYHHNNHAKTLGRMYRITEEQFIDVVLQENGLSQECDSVFTSSIFTHQ